GGERCDDVIAAVDDSAGQIAKLTRLVRTFEERRALYEAWEARGLVTLALQGSLDDGASASLSTQQGNRSVLRRVALVLTDLAEGRQPLMGSLVLRANDLKISIPALRRIDRSPPFALIAQAEVVGLEELREPIDLDTAVAEAFENSPNLGSIRADLDARDTAVASSVASWLPAVDVAVQMGFTDPNAVSPLQAATSVTGALTAEQLAFSDGAVVNVNVQQDLRKARTAEWSAAEQDLVYDVSSAYVGLIRARAVLDVRRADLDRVRESLQVAQDRQAVGSVSATEVARWESEFASAEANLVSAFYDVQNVQIGLNQLMGADTSRSLQPEPLDDLVTNIPGDLTSPRGAQIIAEALAGFAETRAPELEQLRHLVRSQDRLARLQRRQYWMPTVAGSFTVNGNFFLSNVDGGGGTTTTPTGTPTGGAGFDPSAFIVNPPLFTWQAGVSASLPLFAGGGRRASQLEAERNLRSVEMQQETLRQAVVARSRDGVNNLFTSALRAELGAVQVKAVQRTLNAAIDSYARGATTQTTVTEARTSALSAELGSTNAIYDTVQAVFDVLFVAGALPTPSSPNGPAELRSVLADALEAP
ncbi:MAG: TolC family protein, partial [Myxococcota bacterium]